MLDSENIQFYNDGEDSDEDEFADSNNEINVFEEESSNNVQQTVIKNDAVIDHRKITDKQFYKEMQKLKDRGTNAVPPKKAASAYIIYCAKVSPKFKFLPHQKRAEILKRNPMAKVTEVVKDLARCWKRMTKEEIQPFKELAKRGKCFVSN